MMEANKELNRMLHKGRTLSFIAQSTLETCALNFSDKVLFVPVSTAELEDLKTKKTDPQDLPYEVKRLSVMQVEKDPNDGTFRRSWLQATHTHIDRTCTRMWRPSKRLRQQIRDTGTTGDALVELYTSCFPDRVVATENGQPSNSKGSDGKGSDGQRAGRWEILLPNLVTFVSRGEVANGGPVTEIKYLKPGERDRQDRAAFNQILTDSFSCERVRAPDIGARWHPCGSHIRRRFIGKFADSRLGPGEYSRTMLVFVAGVCAGEGSEVCGGIGIVTKDTAVSAPFVCLRSHCATSQSQRVAPAFFQHEHILPTRTWLTMAALPRGQCAGAAAGCCVPASQESHQGNPRRHAQDGHLPDRLQKAHPRPQPQPLPGWNRELAYTVSLLALFWVVPTPFRWSAAGSSSTQTSLALSSRGTSRLGRPRATILLTGTATSRGSRRMP
jgi:hypothetical protein